MKLIDLEIKVEGQLTGPAVLHGYLTDNLELWSDRKRPAVIICAGGGYWRRSDRESEPVALQFLAMGVHVFVLDYSVAPNLFPTSLRELAKAVAAVREHGEEYHVDINRIVVCGFSAAGHLCCSLGTFWDKEFVYHFIGKKPEMIRPDAMILCYPVITGGEFAHEGSMNNLLGEEADAKARDQVSLEKWVTEKTPKAFIWHTVTDETVPVENSLLLAAALQRKGVNYELHIYPSGGHGLSLGTEESGGRETALLDPQCRSWISLVKNWLHHL